MKCGKWLIQNISNIFNVLRKFSWISVCFPAGNGCPTGGLRGHVPVWHPGLWVHHSCCHPYPCISVKVCVGAPGSWHQWTPLHYICNYKLFRRFLTLTLERERRGSVSLELLLCFSDSGDHLQQDHVQQRVWHCDLPRDHGGGVSCERAKWQIQI